MAQLTKRAIKKSFLKLLKEMSFDRITVKEIAEDCGINRNTFYYHYPDIYELLYEIVENRADQVLQMESGEDFWREQCLDVVRYARENRAVIYHIYKVMDRQRLERYLYSVAERIMREYVDRQAEGMTVSDKDKNNIVEFYKCALVGVVLQWVDGDMKGNLEEFVIQTGALQEGVIKGMLLKAQNSSKL